jgi:hypothetical protein
VSRAWESLTTLVSLTLPGRRLSSLQVAEHWLITAAVERGASASLPMADDRSDDPLWEDEQADCSAGRRSDDRRGNVRSRYP